MTFYKQVRGDLTNFKVREAFYAYANIIKLLSGAKCVQAINADNGIHHFIFTTKSHKQLHIIWTRDRGCIEASSLYTEMQLERGHFIDAIGQVIQDKVLSFSERPIFIEFEQSRAAEIK